MRVVQSVRLNLIIENNPMNNKSVRTNKLPERPLEARRLAEKNSALRQELVSQLRADIIWLRDKLDEIFIQER